MIKTNIKIFFLSTFLVFSSCLTFAQENISTEKRVGIITYISSQYYYVQFDKTNFINVGDTLYANKNSKNLPMLIVRFISSRSCACEKITNNDLKINDQLFAVIKKKIIEETQKPLGNNIQSVVKSDSPTPRSAQSQKNKRNTWGRISAQTISSLTNTGYSDKSLRWRYSFQLTTDSIAQSPISFSTYLFFAYNSTDWARVKANLGNALKIYDMFLSYKLKDNSMLWLGRHLNYKVSSIGSIDGLQYEKISGKYFYGGIVGSHPDFSDYGFNLKMFEFGAYAGRIDSINNASMENTFAFFNQTNNFKTDRRYLYFQHSNNLIKNVNFFASSELDLYKNIMDTKTNNPTLTSLFLSLYFRPSHLISLSLSYDARRSVVFYETYKTLIDSLFQNELMQGYRANVYLRPFNNFSISFNGGYRNRAGDSKPSVNFGTSLYYSSLPFLNVNANISYTKLESSYNNGSSSDIRIDKYIDALNMNLALGYRYMEYKLFSGGNLIQNAITGDLSFLLPFDLYLSLSIESTFEKQTTYQRYFIDLTRRF